ncbi:GH25 family lysozyme [Terrisporobacter petrolearius]|uniref:GH25 family lysozyme n=1 Tax=Terrisporobacter petrolearius TaxID=1460447 RepID=UPI0031CC41B5
MRNSIKKFLAIFLASIICFCSFQNLSYTFAAENSVLSKGYVHVTSAPDKLNVRSKPSTSSNIIGTIDHKKSVNIVDSVAKITKVYDKDSKSYTNVVTDPWYKISYPKGYGYVSADHNYVKLSNEDKPYQPSNSTAVKGIDVSYHQGNINWNKVKNSGVKFAIIRGGSGTKEDSKFKANIEGALNAGIEVGVYWFSNAYTVNSAKDEAQKCMEVISPYKNMLSFPVFFDYEEYTIKSAQDSKVNLGLRSVSNICETFLSKLKSNGYKCGIYTNKTVSKFYLSDNLRNSYDFWIAQYSDNCNYWGKYTMWQYSKIGKVDGINGNVDLNYYYKTNPISISKTTIDSIPNQKYTGSKITLNISMKYNNKTLVKNKDYTISFNNNTSIGTATATIKGNGNYSGTKKITFKIVPKTVTNAKISNTTSSSIKLSWSKVANADGYIIYRSYSKNGTYTKIKDITKNSTLSYTDSRLSSNKKYYYKIKSFKTSNKEKYSSYYSSIINGETNLSTPTVKLSTPKSKSIKVSWKKISGSKGYEVYKSTSKNGKYSKTTTSSLSYTNTNLIKKKTYYYKVRAYKVVKNKKVYSSYSSIKSISTK